VISVVIVAVMLQIGNAPNVVVSLIYTIPHIGRSAVWVGNFKPNAKSVAKLKKNVHA